MRCGTIRCDADAREEEEEGCCLLVVLLGNLVALRSAACILARGVCFMQWLGSKTPSLPFRQSVVEMCAGTCSLQFASCTLPESCMRIMR
jgi:hypothetical protein